jgi:hypothetical protein
MTMALAAVLLAGVGVVDRAEAGDPERDRREWRRGRSRDRGELRFGRRDRYFVDREVRIIREYYRPHYRALPRGLRHKYYRSGYLPRGWARRIRPVPVYVERELVVLPHGYRRGIIDGHAVVYDRRGFIIDVAVLF